MWAVRWLAVCGNFPNPPKLAKLSLGAGMHFRLVDRKHSPQCHLRYAAVPAVLIWGTCDTVVRNLLTLLCKGLTCPIPPRPCVQAWSPQK